MKIYILTWKEFLKELKMSYFELVGYLKKKYGMVWFDYGKGTDNIRGLFIHHIMEWWWPDLSSANGKQTFPGYQKRGYLVFCNWLEHLLLHAKIFMDSPHRIDGDKGATKFMIPQIYTYLELDMKAANINQTYYDNISNKKTALRIFKRLVVMFGREYNTRMMISMVREAEENLESDGKHSYTYEQIIEQCNSGIPWNESEIDALRKYYPKYGTRDNKLRKILTKINGKDIRTNYAIMHKAVNLGIRSKRFKSYNISDETKEYIICNYPEMGATKLRQELAKDNINISRDAIIRIAKKHNVSYNRGSSDKKWTKEDDELLEKQYALIGGINCAKLLNRSLRSVHARASSLHIKAGTRIVHNPAENSWLEKEDNFIIDRYPIIGGNGVYEELKQLNISPVERTKSAICHRAQRLGVKKYLKNA